MKQILLVILAVIVMNITSKAQSLVLQNDRTCPVYFSMTGGCPGTPCAFNLGIIVPPLTTLPFFTMAAAIAASTTPGAIPPACGPAFAWHYAGIQNYGGCCDGGGVSVGDGACLTPPFSDCVTTCSLFCAEWLLLQQPPGAVKVRAY